MDVLSLSINHASAATLTRQSLRLPRCLPRPETLPAPPYSRRPPPPGRNRRPPPPGIDVASSGRQDAPELAHANDIRRRFADRNVTTGQILVFGLTGGRIPLPGRHHRIAAVPAAQAVHAWRGAGAVFQHRPCDHDGDGGDYRRASATCPVAGRVSAPSQGARPISPVPRSSASGCISAGRALPRWLRSARSERGAPTRRHEWPGASRGRLTQPAT